MKKLAVLCLLPLLLAACHHDRKSSAMPCYDDLCTAEAAPIQYIITYKDPILFQFDSAEIAPSFNEKLDMLAEAIRQDDKTSVRLNGYTDNVGTDAYNMGLSARRAQAVADALLKRGISADNIVISGYGKADPISSNDTEEGRQENRRVEMELLVK